MKIQFFIIVFLIFCKGIFAQENRDSILEAGEHISMEGFFRDTLESDSFFRSHYAIYLLPKTQMAPDSEWAMRNLAPVQVKHAGPGLSLFFVVIGIALLLLVIKFTFTKLFTNSILSFYSKAAISDIIYDRYSPRWLFAFFANLFFILVVSLWAYQEFVILASDQNAGRIDYYFEIVAILLGIYAVKFLVHLVAGFLIEATDAVLAYLLNVSVTHLVCGILMFFVTLLIIYSPWRGPLLFNISLGTLGLFILIRYIKNFIQTIQFFRYNYLYLILYLCTLEITPWFLIIKYLNNHL
jgi:hypothetical protein